MPFAWITATAFGVVKNFDFFNPLAYPLDFYWLMAILIVVCIVLATNLQNSRIGRAWMAVREDEVAAAADQRLVIPIAPGLRSLNVAMAAAMALGEALRQTASEDSGMRRQ